MKKAYLFFTVLIFSFPLFSQQEFSVNINRPKKMVGSASKISVLYLGQQKGPLKNTPLLITAGYGLVWCR